MYSWSMIAAMLSVLVSTLVIGISRYAHAAPPPNFLCTFITFQVTQSLLFLPQVNMEGSKTYNQLEENFNDVNESHSDVITQTSAPKHLQIQQYWIILATAIDHILCLIYLIFFVSILIK
ncbi:hypothetical protein L798_12592 [Zootermopsis nevadensis]|uniref:Uncharacterized protein n=2 Tax=Zootermopsis nevadensis TaxID=136037 RepID=A0A067QVY6_ZOONE|nr:hypothetical protein L798_12592 [Zootermopsis nevadensis]